MNKREVNVKTATRKSPERWEEGTVSIEIQAKKIIESVQNKLKEGYSISIAASSQYGQQIELRREGQMVWRAWTFEPDFIADLNQQIGFVKNA
ncbi:DUF905 family protein [Serratia plymuthica]|nr:DUF905 family protein [Serratia plymuthica]